VFGKAVIVAGNGAGADVGFRADFGVADVGEMRNLGPFADGALFDFDEIADAGAFEEVGFRAEAGEGTDDDFGFDAAFGEDAVGLDENIVAENGVVKDAAGTDGAARADFGFAEELDGGFEDGVFAGDDVGIDEDGFGELNGDAVAHELIALPFAEGAVDGGEIGASVAAEGFAGIGGDIGQDGFAFGVEDGDGVGEIEFAMLVVGLDLGERGPEFGGGETVDAGIDFVELALVGSKL